MLFHSRLPFNWKTPSGYLIAFLLQAVSIFCVAQTCACNLNLLFGSCEMLISFTKDIKEQLEYLSFLCANNQSEEQQTELKQKLSEFIQFHSTAKGFGSNFNWTYYGKKQQNITISFQIRSKAFEYLWVRLYSNVSVEYFNDMQHTSVDSNGNRWVSTEYSSLDRSR